MGRKLKLSEISKTPFDCCSWWHVCDYGRKRCVHQEDDPAYAQNCTCYKRNHSIPKATSYEGDCQYQFDERTGQGCLF